MSDQNPKIVVLTPIKNEEWILDRFLAVTSRFADHIIIADQCSSDHSLDICRRFDKVKVIQNRSPVYDEAQRQFALIQAARDLVPGRKILLALDADEILAADALHRPGWQTMLNAEPGTVLFFEKPDLYITPNQCKGAASYVQYVQGPSWTWAHFPGSKDAISQNLSSLRPGAVRGMTTTFKPPGTTTGGGGAGAYAGLVFPLAFVLPLLPGRLGFGGIARATLAAIGVTLLVFIFINAVRSALVSAACGVLLCGLLAGRPLRRRMLAALAACLALGSVAYCFSQGVSQNGTVSRFATTLADPVDALHQDRRTFFDDAAFIAVHSPLGVGLGRVGGAGGRLGGGGADPGFAVFSEAYLGAIMYETGIIGGLLSVGIALSLIGRGFLALRRLTKAGDQLLAAAAVAVLVVIFANFFVTLILLAPPGSVLFWLLNGAVLRVFAVPISEGRS